MTAREEFISNFNGVTLVMRAFAYNLTKNKNDAQDLFQETAFRAIKNYDKFRPETNLKAWLMTIMKNVFINDYRRKAKRNTILDSSSNDYFLDAGGPTVINTGEGSMLSKELKLIISDLEDGLRIPFMMHYKGYKYQEIATHLEMPLGTIKSRIFFARRILKKKLKGRFPEFETN